MKREIRTDLYTQAEWGKKVGLSRARINQLIKAKQLNTVEVNGATLIKG